MLIISDDDALASALEAVLPREARVERARTASEAVASLMSAPSDLVLVDDPLPDADGLQVLQQVTKAWRDARVCFVTGRHDADRERQVRRLGVVYYTARPLELSHLGMVLNHALGAVG